MITLNPRESEPAHLISSGGIEPDIVLFPYNARQIIVFPVVLGGRSHALVQLTTGESLRSMEGHVRLYRGLQYQKQDERMVDSRGLKPGENGERIVDYIQYNPASAGDEDIPPSPSSYTVYLQVEERIFDQVVMLSQTCGLPSIYMRFDYNHGLVTYGDASDGSEVLWKNADKLWEPIRTFSLTHSLLPT